MRSNAVRAKLLIGFALLALAGCNTVQGAGEDMQAGGRAVERAAERNR